MALLKITSFDKIGEIEDAYHRVTCISLVNGESTLEVSVAVYRSEAMRNVSISNILKMETHQIPLAANIADIIVYAYTQLKLLPAFAGATDC